MCGGKYGSNRPRCGRIDLVSLRENGNPFSNHFLTKGVIRHILDADETPLHRRDDFKLFFLKKHGELLSKIPPAPVHRTFYSSKSRILLIRRAK